MIPVSSSPQENFITINFIQKKISQKSHVSRGEYLTMPVSVQYMHPKPSQFLSGGSQLIQTLPKIPCMAVVEYLEPLVAVSNAHPGLALSISARWILSIASKDHRDLQNSGDRLKCASRGLSISARWVLSIAAKECQVWG